MAALKAHWEKVQTQRDGRAAPRRKLHLEVLGITASGEAAMTLIHNISTSGLLIETSAELSVGDTFEIDLPDEGAKSAIIIWNSGRLYGCEFEDPVPTAVISAAVLRTPPERPSPAAHEMIQPLQRDRGWARDDNAIRHGKLPLRTRALIIVGFSFFAWIAIISMILLIVRQ